MPLGYVFLVAVASAVLVALLASFMRQRRAFLWVTAVAVPFAISYFGYWAPAWQSKTDRDQYAALEVLGVGVPFVPALIVSGVIVHVAAKRRAKEPGLPRA